MVWVQMRSVIAVSGGLPDESRCVYIQCALANEKTLDHILGAVRVVLDLSLASDPNATLVIHEAHRFVRAVMASPRFLGLRVNR